MEEVQSTMESQEALT